MRASPRHPSLELVATMHGRYRTAPSDDLAEVGTAAPVLKRLGLAPDAGVHEADLQRLRHLREVVYALLEHEVHPDQDVTVELRAVNDAAAYPPRPVALQLDEVGRLAPHTTTLELGHVLGTIARDAIDLLAGHADGLLKQCVAETCGTYFVDTSPGHRRRWCSSATCGNRARVQTHRARQQQSA